MTRSDFVTIERKRTALTRWYVVSQDYPAPLNGNVDTFNALVPSQVPDSRHLTQFWRLEYEDLPL